MTNRPLRTPQAGGYDERYRCEHYDGKARVADWMRPQPSNPGPDGMAWSVVTSGPYMDMLFNVRRACGVTSRGQSDVVVSQMMFGPLKRRTDGTAVFVTPVGRGHVPMIALTDLGFFARYTFDHREVVSGREMKIASDMVGWDYLKATFEKVTGRRAEVVHQTIEEWFGNFDGVDDPVANERKVDGSTSWRQNFSAWWALWRDDVISRDMTWVRKVHPGALTLERWMRENNYTGELRRVTILKNTEDGKTIRPKRAVIERL